MNLNLRLQPALQRGHRLVHRWPTNHRVDEEAEPEGNERRQRHSHGPRDENTAILLRKIEYMEDFSKIRVSGDKAEDTWRGVFCDLHSIGTIFLGCDHPL